MNDSGRPAATPPEGAGAMLHSARRKQNLSLGDVSRHLKLSVRQVEALERDDFAPFGGPVFVHGFIRNYAKLLEVDAEPLVQAADAKMLAPGPTPLELQGAAAEEREPKRRNLAAAGLVVFVLVAGAVAFYASRTERAGPVMAPETVQPTDAAAPAIVPPASEAGSPSTQGGVPVKETESAAPSGETGVLRMVFDQESWVEVTDRSGKAIFSQLNPAGARRKVTGEPPLSVVVGNAGGVRLSYNDRDVDLTPYTRVDVARLTLK